MIRNNAGRKEKRLWTENEPGALVHFRQFQNGFEEAERISEIFQAISRRAKPSTGIMRFFTVPMHSRVFLRKN